MTEFVITVDEHDNAVGVMEKMEVHEKAVLHRAFSVFIFNAQGQMLIHQRAMDKYHSGGKWTNACCGHPRPHESTSDAAHRRLYEEMGIRCALHPQFSFIYKATLDNNLTEHELDHVYFGEYNETPEPNSDEVMNYQWIGLTKLQEQVNATPGNYTEWFKICLDEVITRLS